MTYTLAFTPKSTDLEIRLVGLPLMSWRQAHKAAEMAQANHFDVVVFNTRAI